MRPPAALERAWGSGAPGRDRGASRPSGALTRVQSTAPNPQIPPHAPRYARDPLTLRPTPASALLQPGPAGCRRGRGARWARRGGSARAARDRVGRVGRAERSARRLASAGCPCRRRRCAEARWLPERAVSRSPQLRRCSCDQLSLASFLGRHRRMAVEWKQTILGDHHGPRKTRSSSASSCPAARRLTLSRYVARLKPRCGSLSLSLFPPSLASTLSRSGR